MAAQVATARDLDWRAARAAAQRIVRICDDVAFVAPEDTGSLRRNLVEVCERLIQLTTALRITPPRMEEV